MTTHYDWDKYYVAAALETDWRKMPLRVRAAEVAIREKQRKLAESQCEDVAQRFLLAEALIGLRSLLSEAASWQASQNAEVMRVGSEISSTHLTEKAASRACS